MARDREALKRRRKRQLRRRIRIAAYGIMAAVAVLIIAGIIFGSRRASGEEQAAGTETETEDKAAQQDKEAEEQKKKQEEIEKVIREDAYGEQLGILYKSNPEVEAILLNRDSYPDWLIEYFAAHKEAADWVIQYPEYSAKSQEEIDNAALQPVDLHDYYIRRNIPIYYQWDLVWGYASYGDGTIAVEGCGPTCLSMVVTGLTGDVSATPKKIADFSLASGYYTETYGTDWTLMSEGAAQYGLTGRQLTSWSVDAILAELNAGHPIICSVSTGDFTNQGHFIVLTGVTADGMIMVNDPNSRVNTRKKWEPQRLLDQMEAMWAYSTGE